MASLLLDRAIWDLVIDASGDIAVCTDPYAAAQDAASAIKTFAGEVFYDTSLGVPYLTEILGKNPSIPLLKAEMQTAALSMPGVATAQCFISGVADRTLGGQVQVTAESGAAAAADFAVINPQGAG